MSNNKNQGGPKKPAPITYYYIAVIVGILLLNLVFGNSLRSQEIEEVSFSRFQKMVDEEQVDKVVRFPNRYEFEATDDEGNTKKFKTGLWVDDELTQKLLDSDVQFTSEIQSEPNHLLSFLLTFVLPIGLMIWLGRRLIQNMTGGARNAMSFGKSNAKIYVKAETGATFEDVAGQDEAKDSLVEIIDFLKDPRKYSNIGAKIPKGVLLVGPPGTGKTLLARAVAGEADVPFFSISGSEFVEMFVGLGASKVRDLFKQAKEKAPCIVFIDEIDAIGKRRDTGGLGGNDEREQTLNQLLSEMDGFEENSGVVILAATNRPEVLDPALTRAGRFDRQIPVELPDIQGREDILKVHANDVVMEDNVDFRLIARMTAGSSGADLANIINEGALRAVRHDRRVVTEEDLIESVEVVIAGEQKKNAVITPRDRKIIAYHEVGHALVAAFQKGTAPVTKITIIPRTSGALGYTMTVDEEEKVLMTKQDIFQEIVKLIGGRAAEEVVFKTRTTGASNDIERATKLARSMVTRFGMTDEFNFVALETAGSQYLGGESQLTASPNTAEKIDKMVQSIINQAHEKAIQIVSDNEQQLHDISDYLLEKETITGEEFMEVLNRSLIFYGKEPLEDQDDATIPAPGKIEVPVEGIDE